MMMDYDPRLAEIAFNEGMEARRLKRPPTSLPYFPDSDEGRAWYDGWHEADALDQLGIFSPGPDSTRKPGFYWVHEGGDTRPEPAYWDGKGWAMIGLETALGRQIVLSELPIVFQT